MAEIASQRIEIPVPIHYLLKPFRSDRLNFPATFISNGRKVHMAAQAHIPHFINDEIAEAMEVAENACHLHHGTRATGPTEVDGVPYPLVVVTEKGAAAERVTNSMNSIGYGAGVVTDAVFMVDDMDHKISFTAHKPKTERDKEELIGLFLGAGMKGNVHLSTATGIYRFEFGRPDRLVPELYMIQTHLGEIKPHLNTEALYKHLSSNGGKTAAGLTVPLALELLVKPSNEIAVDVFKFGEVPNLQSMIYPLDGKTIIIPGYNIDALHLAGVGFVN